jgi:transcriptional regulator with GAF, ATPase, and Fis domain
MLPAMGGEPAIKKVKDRTVRYTFAMTTVGLLAASVVFGSSVSHGLWKTAAPYAAYLLAATTGVLGFYKFANERAYKAQQEGEKLTLEQALKAESRRTSLLINGAMLGTAEKLRCLAALSGPSKQVEIAAFRASIVSKVCDLVRSDAPRAAYFRVEDPYVRPRVMRCGSYIDSRNREDMFTSEFREGVGADQGVWELIDDGDAAFSNDTDKKIPAGWDANSHRRYKSFASVAVRADELAFGMLTANTVERDGFTDSDIASMKVLARLLAAAEAIAGEPRIP